MKSVPSYLLWQDIQPRIIKRAYLLQDAMIFDIYSAKFHYHHMDKVFNAKTYINFLEQIIAKYNGKKIFYIQDNAPYHKDGGVWRWFKEHREIIEVFNLPPYSPELNAAEPLWYHTRITGLIIVILVRKMRS